MTRMLFPALILAGPAAAHNGVHMHVHGSDYLALSTGLAFIGLIATVLITKRSK